MVESSGEDYALFLRSSKLLPSLERYITDSNSHLLFVFCSSQGTAAFDDLLFSSFLTHAMSIIPKAQRVKFHATLLACDPDLCQRRLNLALERDCHRKEPLDKEQYVEVFLPKTHAILESFFGTCSLRPFSVGMIQEKEVDGIRVEHIYKPDFDDARSLYEWIEGRLGPATYATRLGDLLRSIARR